MAKKQEEFNEMAATMSLGEQKKLKEMGEVKKRKWKGKKEVGSKLPTHGRMCGG